MATLSSQFKQAITNITVNGAKRARAIKAHTEIRALLESDAQLRGLGVDTVLIGSYARKTGIYPGKDVDVFVKLTKLDTSADPREAFDPVARVLAGQYGDRVELQRRSVKVSFDGDGDGFSVDAVPAVRNGKRWALPNRDRELWPARAERWIETDPELLTELTVAKNKTLQVDGDGAYLSTVRLIRQIRSHHRGDAKPGGLYFEIACYWAFDRGEASGASHAEILATTLRSVAGQLASGSVLVDPALGRPFEPSPNPTELAAAASTFADLAARAEAALGMERCAAAAAWRAILGDNDRGACFPLPSGCDESGKLIAPAVTAITSRGPREAGGFG